MSVVSVTKLSGKVPGSTWGSRGYGLRQSGSNGWARTTSAAGLQLWSHHPRGATLLRDRRCSRHIPSSAEEGSFPVAFQFCERSPVGTSATFSKLVGLYLARTMAYEVKGRCSVKADNSKGLGCESGGLAQLSKITSIWSELTQRSQTLPTLIRSDSFRPAWFQRIAEEIQPVLGSGISSS